MLDKDLAFLYGVRTKHLNQQVKRNVGRFPSDFMFQLTAEEAESLRDRSPRGWWHGKLPYAFTELGAGMLAAILRSDEAAKVTIHILRVFRSIRATQERSLSSEANRQELTLFHAVRDAFLLQAEDESPTRNVFYTYFVQAGTDGPIKIGSTRNLVVRLRTLATLVPVPLQVLGVMKGNHERHCHTRFAAFRTHGEWFVPCEAILQFVSTHTITSEAMTRNILISPNNN